MSIISSSGIQLNQLFFIGNLLFLRKTLLQTARQLSTIKYWIFIHKCELSHLATKDFLTVANFFYTQRWCENRFSFNALGVSSCAAR